MDNIILNFLEAYKNLDELCKQILNSDIGVSQYIEEMEKEVYGVYYVEDWEKDYKSLKHLRWVRNQLVHDTKSFEKNIVTFNDVQWIKMFQSRIIKCTDPFSMLNKSNVPKEMKRVNNNNYSTTMKNHPKRKSKKIIITIIIILAVISSFIFLSTFILALRNYIKSYSDVEKLFDTTYSESENDIEYSDEIENDNQKNDKVKFDTLIYTGENSETIKGINLPEGDYYIIGKYYGSGNFIAEFHKSIKDNYGELIANKIGKCETIYGFQGPIKNGYINVEGDTGKWKFKIVACKRIKEDKLKKKYTYSGHGAEVIPNINLPNGEYYITCLHEGDGNFAVSFYDSIKNNYGELIANEIGKTKVTYGIQGPISKGYIDIDMADGDWTIIIEPCNE